MTSGNLSTRDSASLLPPVFCGAIVIYMTLGQYTVSEMLASRTGELLKDREDAVPVTSLTTRQRIVCVLTLCARCRLAGERRSTPHYAAGASIRFDDPRANLAELGNLGPS